MVGLQRIADIAHVKLLFTNPGSPVSVSAEWPTQTRGSILSNMCVLPSRDGGLLMIESSPSPTPIRMASIRDEKLVASRLSLRLADMIVAGV